MNKLKVYKFIVNRKEKKKVTPSLDTGCRVGGVTWKVMCKCVGVWRVMCQCVGLYKSWVRGKYGWVSK